MFHEQIKVYPTGKIVPNDQEQLMNKLNSFNNHIIDLAIIFNLVHVELGESARCVVVFV